MSIVMKNRAKKYLSPPILLLILVCHGLFAEELAFEEMEVILKDHNNQELVDFMEERLSQSSMVVIQHIPISVRAWHLREKKSILTDWQYKLILNCTLDCGGRNKSLLKEIVRRSVRELNGCPLPINTVVRFMNTDESVLDMYFHQSGHCFTIGEQSYYTNRSFNPLEDFDDI